MNFLKRALLSVKARKGKSLLQVFIFTVICIFVLAGLSIQSAAEKSSELARQKLGADVTLQVDMDKVREQMQSQQGQGERVRFQSTPLPIESADELIEYEQIKGYNYYLSTMGLASNFDPIENETDESETSEGENAEQGPGRAIFGGGMSLGDLTLEGVAFTDSVSEFMEETSAIVEGRHITDDDIGSNVALIEQTLAEDNDLQIGELITVANPADDSLTIELEIVGIYKTTSTGSNMGMDLAAMNPYNKLYVPYTAAGELKGSDYEGTIDSAIYYLNDPEDVQAFIENAEANSSIDFNTFKLDANDLAYQQMVGPIENVASFSKNIVYLVSIAGAIILGLIVMMSIRERKYEMGVLLALGEKKWKLAGQFMVEILMVAIISFGIAAASGNVVAGALGDQLMIQEIESAEQSNAPESLGGPGNMGGFRGGMMAQQFEQTTPINEIDVQVTANDLSILAMIGVLITIISALIPSISVLRLHPKTILSKED